MDLIKLKLTQLIHSILLFSIFFSLPSIADTERKADLVIQYATADYDDDLASGIDPTAIVFRFVPATDNLFGYEGRLGLGISEGSDTIDSAFGRGELEVDVHTLLGLYLNTRSSIGDLVSVYGVIGFSWVRYDLIFNDTPLLYAEDESGLSYGFGIDLGKQDSVRFNLEFMQYLDKDDFDVSAVSLGVVF